MKIVMVNNFDRPDISDVLIAENVNPAHGALIVNLLNYNELEDTDDFYRLVEDDYVLKNGDDVYK